MGRILARLSAPFVEFGWFDGAIYSASRVLERVSFGRCRVIRYLLVAQPVPKTPDNTRHSAKTIIEQVGPGSEICSAFPRPPSVIAARFAAGHRCYVATVSQKFAGFIWLARGHYEEDEVFCRFVLAQPDRSAWDFDVYVDPAFRLGRTFSRLWETANRVLANEGVQWSFSRISTFNPTSIRNHTKLGIRTVGTATFLCVWRAQLAIANRRPYLNVSWGRAGRPEIALHVPREGA